MAQDQVYHTAECLQGMQQAWDKLNQYLAGLSEGQLTAPCDPAGWNVKDHVTHLAAWEESVALMFTGKIRYEVLGVSRELYLARKFEEMNAAVRLRWLQLSPAEALARLRSVHAQMVELVEGMPEAQLNQTMEELFPSFSKGDTRKIGAVIYGNTEHHFLEHLPWMQALSG